VFYVPANTVWAYVISETVLQVKRPNQQHQIKVYVDLYSAYTLTNL